MKFDRFLLVIVFILLITLMVSIDVITDRNRQINELIGEYEILFDEYLETYSELSEIKHAATMEENYNEAATYIAKTVWGEARGCTDTEKAAVMWCILNRVDKSYDVKIDSSSNPGADLVIVDLFNAAVVDVVTAPAQFYGYRAENPVDQDIYDLALDVIGRYIKECGGQEDVGRVLPKGYCWFNGDGQHNYFRNSWIDGTEWDWSLESPYV